MQDIKNDPKRARLIKLRESGAIVYIHPCSKCGNKNAPFGHSEQRTPPGKWQSIVWFCFECNGDKKAT